MGSSSPRLLPAAHRFLILDRPGTGELACGRVPRIARRWRRPLAIRTLDPGGDKPIPTAARTAIPALGCRMSASLGRRISERAAARHPARRARVPAAPAGRGDRRPEARIRRIAVDAPSAGHGGASRAGRVIETPRGAARRFSRRGADFSRSANDLAQYTLAIVAASPTRATPRALLRRAALSRSCRGRWPASKPSRLLCARLRLDAPYLIALACSSLRRRR